MNVIILQIKGKKAIALNNDGEILAIAAQKGMRPGCAFIYEKPALLPAYRVLPAVAASLLVFLSGAALWMSFAVSSYVDININPGVRMSLNAFGRVLKTEAINNDGQELLSGMNTRLFSGAETELAQVISLAIDSGYLKDSNGVLITISDDDTRRAESREKSLFSTSLKCLQDKNIQAAVITQKISRGALVALRRQENTGSGNARDRYLNKAWHADSNPLYIDRAEAVGGDRIKIVFSRDVGFTGAEKIVLTDQQGHTYKNKVIGHESDEWLLQCRGLTGGRSYCLTVTSIEKSTTMSAFLMITGSANDGDTGSNGKGRKKPSDGGNANEGGKPSKRPAPTPGASQDDDGDEMETGQPGKTESSRLTPSPDDKHKPNPTFSGDDEEEDDEDDGEDEDTNNDGESRMHADAFVPG